MSNPAGKMTRIPYMCKVPISSTSQGWQSPAPVLYSYMSRAQRHGEEEARVSTGLVIGHDRDFHQLNKGCDLDPPKNPH